MFYIHIIWTSWGWELLLSILFCCFIHTEAIWVYHICKKQLFGSMVVYDSGIHIFRDKLEDRIRMKKPSLVWDS